MSNLNNFLYVDPQDLKQILGEILREVIAPKEEEADFLLSSSKAAEMLNVDRSTLWRWRKNNYLMPVRVGGKVMYRMADINKIMEGKYHVR